MSRARKNGAVSVVRQSDNALLETAEESLSQEVPDDETPEMPDDETPEVIEPETPDETPGDETPDETLNYGPEPVVLPESGVLVVAADGRGVHANVRVKFSEKAGKILFTSECGWAYVFEREATTADVLALCSYCADGSIAPEAVQPAKVKAPKAAKLAPVLTFEEQIEAEQKLAEERRAILSAAFATLHDSFRELPEWPATSQAIEILETALRSVKGTRARTPGAVAGTKAPRAVYVVGDRKEGDSDALAMIRQYANQGDERAQAIIAHVDSWVDADGKYVSTADKIVGGICPTCNSDKHLRRTGFFSAEREIEKMRERAAKPATAAA
jgi:hypothetical protein